MIDNSSKEKGGRSHCDESWGSAKERLNSTVASSRYQISDGGNSDRKSALEWLDAHDIALNRPVVIRRMNASSESPESRMKFVREAQLTGGLQHPNIIPVHDLVSSSDGDLLFSLRSVEGRGLGKFLSEGSSEMSLNESLTIFLKICNAIAFAHQNHTAHGAISEDSIVIGNHGEVFVINWNRAQSIDEGDDGESASRDVYALGKMLERMITHACSASSNKPSHSTAAILAKVADENSQFYTTVDELLSDLVCLQEGRPTKAENANPARQFVLFAMRKKIESFSLLAGLLLVTGVTAYFMHQIHLQKERAVSASDLAFHSQLSAEDSSRKQLEHLKQLQRLVPMLREQINADLANGELMTVLDGIAVSLELVPDDYVLLQLKGDVLQALFRLDESIDSYNKVLKIGRTVEVESRIALSQKYRGFIQPEVASPADNVLMAFCREMKAAQREYEVNYILKGFQTRQADAISHLLHNSKGASNGWKRLKSNNDIAIKAGQGAGYSKVIWHCTTKSGDGFDELSEIPYTCLEAKKCDYLTSLSSLSNKPLLFLTLMKSRVTDLGPLTGLPLRELRMFTSNVQSLKPLANLPLEILTLQNAPYSDLSPIADLPLRGLDITGSHVSSIKSIRNLKLNELHIVNTPVTSLDGIPTDHLLWLDANGSGIRDIDSLKGSKVERLNISNTATSDLSPVKGLPLKKLDISNTKVTVLDSLMSLPMERLNIAGTKIRSVSPIAALSALVHLDISKTSITELPANSWTKLQVFNGSFTDIDDLNTLKGKLLRKVNIEGTPVENIAPVVNRMLYDLNLKDTKVSDLAPLIDSNVKILNLSGTPITHLRSLTTVCLNTLDVSNTAISDLEGIEKLPLASLNIAKTEIRDLTLLKGIPLKEIYLDSDNIVNGCDALKVIGTLKRIVLNGKAYTPKAFYNSMQTNNNTDQ